MVEICGKNIPDLPSIRISSDSLAPNYWLRVFKKDFPMAEAFNLIHLKLNENGLNDYLKLNEGNLSDWNPPISGYYKKNDGYQSLNIKNVLGSFLLLICGLFLSLVVFSCEFVFIKIKY